MTQDFSALKLKFKARVTELQLRDATDERIEESHNIYKILSTLERMQAEKMDLKGKIKALKDGDAPDEAITPFYQRYQQTNTSIADLTETLERNVAADDRKYAQEPRPLHGQLIKEREALRDWLLEAKAAEKDPRLIEPIYARYTRVRNWLKDAEVQTLPASSPAAPPPLQLAGSGRGGAARPSTSPGRGGRRPGGHYPRRRRDNEVVKGVDDLTADQEHTLWQRVSSSVSGFTLQDAARIFRSAREALMEGDLKRFKFLQYVADGSRESKHELDDLIEEMEVGTVTGRALSTLMRDPPIDELVFTELRESENFMTLKVETRKGYVPATQGTVEFRIVIDYKKLEPRWTMARQEWSNGFYRVDIRSSTSQPPEDVVPR